MKYHFNACDLEISKYNLCREIFRVQNRKEAFMNLARCIAAHVCFEI